MPPLSRLAACTPYLLPLRDPFRGLTRREGVLLRGPAGWGEFAPFRDYTARSDAFWAAAAVEAMTGFVPQPLRNAVATAAVLPETDPVRLRELVREAVVGHGCRTVKLKVAGSDAAADIAAVRTVREALEASLGAGAGAGRIRIDANGRWTRAEALAVLPQLADFGLDYVEQPCAAAADVAAVRAADIGVPVAVDETLRRDRVFGGLARVADIAVLKVAPLGGGRATVALAAQLDVPVVISSALESAVGLSRDARVAGAVSDLDLDCGLGTGLLLAADVVAPVLAPQGGAVSTALRAPDPEALAAVRHPDPGGWLERLDRAGELAVAHGLIPPEQIAVLEDVA